MEMLWLTAVFSVLLIKWKWERSSGMSKRMSQSSVGAFHMNRKCWPGRSGESVLGMAWTELSRTNVATKAEAKRSPSGGWSRFILKMANLTEEGRKGAKGECNEAKGRKPGKEGRTESHGRKVRRQENQARKEGRKSMEGRCLKPHILNPKDQICAMNLYPHQTEQNCRQQEGAGPVSGSSGRVDDGLGDGFEHQD
ncbi:hypothetical protein EYF80_060072 [Liparis tanakae]|uniref:Uncharacterized protein n=1 Tax=Liparis tanakae TaxID=230148 RepID=A0A4Z2EM02_9TELE|nr:hypothetical protein EYF80_060072 [Liparis tanakae]